VSGRGGPFDCGLRIADCGLEDEDIRGLVFFVLQSAIRNPQSAIRNPQF
jgi:hypothetical protein